VGLKGGKKKKKNYSKEKNWGVGTFQIGKKIQHKLRERYELQATTQSHRPLWVGGVHWGPETIYGAAGTGKKNNQEKKHLEP